MVLILYQSCLTHLKKQMKNGMKHWETATKWLFKFINLLYWIVAKLSYVLIFVMILWLMYCVAMALWNTVDKGAPQAWYNEHILPLRSVNKTTPPVEEEEYYDEEMYEDEDSDFD